MSQLFVSNCVVSKSESTTLPTVMHPWPPHACVMGSRSLSTAISNFAPLTFWVGRGTLIGDGSAGLSPEPPTGEPGAFFGSG